MKLKFSYLLVVLAVLFVTLDAAAQVDRRIGRNQYRRSGSKDKPADFIQNAVDYYKKELKLDDFQAAAIKEIMECERENLMAINNEQDVPSAERRDKARIIFDRIDTKVLPLLSEDQKKKYKEIRKIEEGESVELESDKQ